MSKTLRKPRWMSWEIHCLKRAFEQKIQLKIIASALGKSVNAISKRIQRLGLREARCLLGSPQDSLSSMGAEGIPLDSEKMTQILLAHAPKQASFARGTEQRNAAYSLTPPLSYTLMEDAEFVPPGIRRKAGEPLYISLRYVEEWALSKGFCPVKGALLSQGIAYWKDGKYFSKAQVLVQVNKTRLEKRLQPLVLCEKEIGG